LSTAAHIICPGPYFKATKIASNATDDETASDEMENPVLFEEVGLGGSCLHT